MRNTGLKIRRLNLRNSTQSGKCQTTAEDAEAKKPKK
jgi:hypothetical protein